MVKVYQEWIDMENEKKEFAQEKLQDDLIGFHGDDELIALLENEEEKARAKAAKMKKTGVWKGLRTSASDKVPHPCITDALKKAALKKHIEDINAQLKSSKKKPKPKLGPKKKSAGGKRNAASEAIEALNLPSPPKKKRKVQKQMKIDTMFQRK